MSNQDAITKRLLEQIGYPPLLEEIRKLSPSDRNSLMLALFSQMTERLEAKDILNNYCANRYVTPSDLDPLAYHALELALLTLSAGKGFTPIMLSPAGLLGSCSALAAVSQNKILSAIRGTEILADPTNMLALHIASGLKNKSLRNDGDGLHFCAAQRLTRVQASFPKGFFPHFGVFCLVSAGQDTGSYSFERMALVKHVALYREVLQNRGRSDMIVEIRGRSGYADSTGFLAKMQEVLSGSFPDLNLKSGESDWDNAYYQGINIKLFLPFSGDLVEIADFGFVDWTQKLLGRKKERLLISAMGMERVLGLK